MSHEPEEKRARPQSSFTRALQKLSDVNTLITLQEKAKKVLKTDEVFICTSTRNDETEKLFFVVNQPEDETFVKLGAKFEKILGCPSWLVVGKQSETPQQFSSMYKNLTLLSPANVQNVQAFVELAEGQFNSYTK